VADVYVNKMPALFMSTKEGNPAKNQKVITAASGIYLESYGKLVAGKLREGTVVLSSGYDYSETTIYYVVKFLGMGLPAIREGIARGEIHIIPHGLAAL
jgi:hypothetical protein